MDSTDKNSKNQNQHTSSEQVGCFSARDNLLIRGPTSSEHEFSFSSVPTPPPPPTSAFKCIDDASPQGSSDRLLVSCNSGAPTFLTRVFRSKDQNDQHQKTRRSNNHVKSEQNNPQQQQQQQHTSQHSPNNNSKSNNQSHLNNQHTCHQTPQANMTIKPPSLNLPLLKTSHYQSNPGLSSSQSSPVTSNTTRSRNKSNTSRISFHQNWKDKVPLEVFRTYQIAYLLLTLYAASLIIYLSWMILLDYEWSEIYSKDFTDFQMIQYSGLGYACIFFICAILGQSALVKVNTCLLLASNILSITSFLVFMLNVVYYEANNTGVQVRFLKKWELYFQNYVNYVFPYLNIAQYSQGGSLTYDQTENNDNDLDHVGSNINSIIIDKEGERAGETKDQFDKSYVEKVMIIANDPNDQDADKQELPAYDSYGEISYGGYDGNEKYQNDPLSLLEENEMFEHTVVNYVQEKFGCCGYITKNEYRNAHFMGSFVREPESCDKAITEPDFYTGQGYPTLGCRFAIDREYDSFRLKLMIIISFTIFFSGFAAMSSAFMMAYRKNAKQLKSKLLK